MQTLYKLIFALMMLQARRDELRAQAARRNAKSKRNLSDATLSPHDAALAHTH